MDSVHVAILSSPGMGHLIPVLVLGNRLASSHNVRVTVLSVTTTAGPPEALPYLGPKLVQVINLPPVDISHLVDHTAQVCTQLCLMVHEALPLVRSAITAMDHRPDALFVDHFCTEALSIAAELEMAKYLYIPSTAWFTALVVYSPVLDVQIQGQYIEQQEHLKIPGCNPVRPEDVVDPMLDRNDQQYDEYIKMAKNFSCFDGILLNSWEDLEPTTLRALREEENLRSAVKAPVYPIGPLRRPVKPSCPKKTELIEWLDRQPNNSVLFVSFGSAGVLSAQQITELAWGLELSRQRFVWVVRPPTEGRVDDAFFNMSNGSDTNPDYLPQGFANRTNEVGLLVPKWAPQVEILNHSSVGGFLSHCGWNSILESMTSGVPMIAWPLYAEQRQNATFITEELGVAIRPEVLPTKKVVGREEIEKMVRTLMESREGKVMREKVKQLKVSGVNALSVGGSSHKLMAEVVSKINNASK